MEEATALPEGGLKYIGGEGMGLDLDLRDTLPGDTAVGRRRGVNGFRSLPDDTAAAGKDVFS